MKLVTFQRSGEFPHPGALFDDDRYIADLARGLKVKFEHEDRHPKSINDFIKGGAPAFELARGILEFIRTQRPGGCIVPVEEVKLLAPLPIPESIRACMAFEEHVINCTRRIGLGWMAGFDEALERFLGRKYTIAYSANKAWYERPVYYKSNRFSVVGHDAEIMMPSYAGQLDYELEWGVIIGKHGRDIKEQDAHLHIAGYTIFNDFSARDIQMREMGGRLGPAKGKDFDTGNSFGPCLVTPDAIGDPYNLLMTATVNGREWSRGTTKDMYWTFEEMIAYISRSETLYPGEIITSGTCSGKMGMGCGLEHGKYLKPGDTIELHVENIGTLRNRIA